MAEEKKDWRNGAFLEISATASITVINVVLSGFVLSLLWNWFVVPVFGISKLTFVPAMGIAIIVSVLTYQFHENEKSNEKINKVTFALHSLIALFVGWIVHFFM